MASDRPVWRGQLRLALVSCPVALHPVHHERTNLHFHFLNPKTGNRVRMVTLDAGTEEEISRRDLVRGFEIDRGQYVTLTDEDFETARIDSSAVLAIGKFVDTGSIDPVYYDASYYVVPDGNIALDVYVVLRDAIRASKCVALSRVVIARRERAACLMPMDKGLVLHTLHEAQDIADSNEAFSAIPATRPDADMVKLARQLIDRQTAKFDPADMTDRYEARLRQVIAAKAKGRGVKAAKAPPAPGNVVDLMAALKKSLGEAPKGRKRA